MNFNNKRTQRMIAFIVILIILAMVATSVLPLIS